MSPTTILGWCIIGLIAGVLAKLIMPGKDPGGFVVTILLGIAGAFLGGWLGQVLHLFPAGGPVTNVGAVMAGVGGAVILLTGYRLVMRART
jgi:uncharacterized membrane protein YeaQ/YmgE (transglycosylase-associated protein family)